MQKHGNFFQTPNCHISGSGCPACSESKGESKISLYLTKNNIYFVRQYRVNRLLALYIHSNNKGDSTIRNRPFDFYIPHLRLLIEYDGRQHFEPIEHFGGQEQFQKQKLSVSIKMQFCIGNYINLLRISYKNYNNIGEILKEKLGELSINPLADFSSKIGNFRTLPLELYRNLKDDNYGLIEKFNEQE